MIAFLGLSPALDVTYLVGALRIGEIHRPHETLRLPGGKSLNAARAAHALGAPSRVFAPLGGANGESIARELRAAGVDAEVIAAGGETRECVSVFDEATGELTEFYEPAPDPGDAAWERLADAIAGLSVDSPAGRSGDGGSAWLALSGSVPETRTREVTALLAGAAARGIRVAVDTHGDALATIIDSFTPTIVKVNRSEAAQLVGAGSAAELAERLRSRGVEWAVVTDGAAGAVLAATPSPGAHAEPGSLLRAAPPERGRFTVGSGDCFLAGLLTARTAGESAASCLTLATAAAAANTLVPGAALFAPYTVARLRERVVVDVL